MEMLNCVSKVIQLPGFKPRESPLDSDLSHYITLPLHFEWNARYTHLKAFRTKMMEQETSASVLHKDQQSSSYPSTKIALGEFKSPLKKPQQHLPANT